MCAGAALLGTTVDLMDSSAPPWVPRECRPAVGTRRIRQIARPNFRRTLEETISRTAGLLGETTSKNFLPDAWARTRTLLRRPRTICDRDLRLLCRMLSLRLLDEELPAKVLLLLLSARPGTIFLRGRYSRTLMRLPPFFRSPTNFSNSPKLPSALPGPCVSARAPPDRFLDRSSWTDPHSPTPRPAFPLSETPPARPEIAV